MLMTWIFIFWTGFGTPTVEGTMTYEECATRGRAHVERIGANGAKAFCIKKDGSAVVQIEPDRAPARPSK